MPDTEPSLFSASLDVALAYAQAGLRVLPIMKGTKRPPMQSWVEAATTDGDTIHNWFTGIYKDAGVGLAMGRQPNGTMIFALDIDEHDPAHSGSETLGDLELEHGRLPETVTSITGSGGLHMLFTAPASIEVRNGVAGDGIDVRGEGGQIVVYPSIHPTTGARYEWEDGRAPWETAVAEAPGWLLDLVVKPEPTPAPLNAPAQSTGPFATPDSPAEWLRSQWDWPLQLRDAGWVEQQRDRNGDTHWIRPGQTERGKTGGVLHPGGPFVVFSTDASTATLRATASHINRDGSVSLTPYDFYTAHRHGGDTSAASRAIRAMMDPADSRLSTLDPADPATPGAQAMSRKVKLTPASSMSLRRVRWLWSGRVAVGTLSLLAGPEGLGKSTLAYWLAARITRGELSGEDHGHSRSVLVCATEDSWEHTVYPRLLAHDADCDRVFRMDVESDGDTTSELILPADLGDVEAVAAEVEASLLILDPLMSRLDAHLDSHRDGEVRQALEPLVRSCERSHLACLGLIHHNKSGSTNPNDLVMASKAFTAVARSVHHVVRDPDDETGEVRIFGTTKNNLGRMDLPTPSFTIGTWTYPTYDEHGEPDGTGEVGQLRWGPDSGKSIQSALSKSAAEAGGQVSATDWLRRFMRKNGRVRAGEVYKAADKDKIPRLSLHQAYNKLGLDSDEQDGATHWFDPTDSRLSGGEDASSGADPTNNDTPKLGDIL